MTDILILPGVKAVCTDVRRAPMDGTEASGHDRRMVALDDAADMVGVKPDSLRKKIARQNEKAPGSVYTDLLGVSGRMRVDVDGLATHFPLRQGSELHELVRVAAAIAEERGRLLERAAQERERREDAEGLLYKLLLKAGISLENAESA